jgi:signal transduction histidine kinase/ActR/RegA family two-component response regulator
MPEAELDRITQLATQILGVPSAIISLVDRDRQWFKSKCAIDIDESPRNSSFCSHVVFSKEILLVTDALEDERFFDNPLVTGPPHIRFYLGVPLITSDHYVLGTLCVLDSKPHSPSQAQISQLSLLSDFVMSHLELRRKNLEINRQKHELDQIFNQLQHGIIITNDTGEVINHNQRAQELLSLNSRDKLSKVLLNFNLLDHRGALVLEKALPCELSRCQNLQTQRQLFKCAEDERWFMISSSPLHTESEQYNQDTATTFASLTHISDVSDLVMSQRDNVKFKRKLANQDRFVTVGTLAAGVGHEINNPLSYISANTEYITDMLQELSEGSSEEHLSDCCEEIIDVLGDIKEGANRISQIVAGLNIFARSSDNISPIDLHKILQTSIQMTRHVARPISQVFSLYPDEALWVFGEQSRLSQACINIILNALQSFEEKAPKENMVVIRTRLNSDRTQAIIEIRDNGPGIPAQYRKRVFDPFFTTKAVGQGSGLGLSIAQQNLRHLKGALWFESFTTDEGQSKIIKEDDHSFINIFNQRTSGSDFYLSLPLVPSSTLSDLSQFSPTPIPVLTSVLPTRIKKPRVLLIDDEVSLLRALQRLFASHLDLVILSDPRLAVETCLNSSLPYDLIICDVMMPHLNGVEVYESLIQSGLASQDRFVFVTGGVTQEEVYEAIRRSQCPLLLKPVKLEEILTILSQSSISSDLTFKKANQNE